MITGNCLKAFQYESEKLLPEAIKKDAFTS